jgi:hypothetical protein
MLLRVALAAALATLAAGCGGSADEEAQQPSGSQLPPGCEVAGIQKTVTGLLTAITEGRGIERFVATGDDFTGVAVSDPDRRFLTENRAKAIRFLRGRHRYAENVRLLQMTVAPANDANHVAIRFIIARVASDLPGRGIRTHSASGDGIVNCLSRRVSRFRLASSAG